jgi:uncharacterized 2Fe-2S/4Fe-4S cluster protein (DUF4445 family)
METLSSEVIRGQNLLTWLRENGFLLSSPCGGKGVCGKCRIRVVEGEKTLSMPYPGLRGITLDEWESGWRLACKTLMDEELTIEIPELWNEEANILTDGDYEVTLQPSISKVFLELPKPSTGDQASDADRLQRSLGDAKILDLALLHSLSDILKDNNYKVTAVLQGDTLIGIEGGDTRDLLYGAAVDIGTTTMVGTLIDLNTGDEVGIYSTLNPQKKFGDDVISRISHTIEKEDGLQNLQQALLDELNQMFESFESKYQISAKNIYQLNIVGNTVMIHLFAGLPVKNIASAPFNPVTTRLPNIRAKEMGLKVNPNGAVTSLPMIAGYIGADTVSCILATDMLEDPAYSLLVDIGTNGEIVLGNSKGMLSCATAAGPALEGAHIQCGLGGIKGAINKVEINKNGIRHTTIGDQPAIGICGSGIVDAAAQMLKQGLMDSFGRMLSYEEAKVTLPADIASRVSEYNGKPSLIITDEKEGAANKVFITQKDIREIQLAKAAIAAGIQILMKEMQIDFDDIEKVYLAGGFGNYINHDHAMEIGLLPAECKGKVIPIGNAALTGAKMVTKSIHFTQAAEKIRQKTGYIELSNRIDFQDIFVDNMGFK